jgi:lambda repressor-like predicted transcriptional regulator
MRHKDLPATKPHPRIRAELSARGLTMADLSRASGVGYLTLTRTLSGLQGPSRNVRERVALALGMSDADLWGAS